MDSSSGSTGSSSGADAASGADASSSGGPPDARPDSPVCTGDLSNIHGADFSIAVTVKTTQSGLVSLLNQRSSCGPTGTFWDVRLSSGGVRAEINDNTTAVNLTSLGLLVNDGQPHDVLVQRFAGTMTILIDGSATGSIAAPSSLGALPALKSGTDVCDGHSAQVPFMGTMSNVCIASP
jgi:hypothetical protein